jgi:DNA-binding NarL/FixJ family response regulator
MLITQDIASTAETETTTEAEPAHDAAADERTDLAGLLHLVLGMSNDEIAAELVVSRLTAKTHVSRILYKLHARDRAQLVMLAYESGMVVPGS